MTMVVFWDMQRGHRRSREHIEHRPVHAFSSFFFDKMLGKEEDPPRNHYLYKPVRRWGRKARSVEGDIFKLKMLLIPANPDGAFV